MTVKKRSKNNRNQRKAKNSAKREVLHPKRKNKWDKADKK